MQARAGSALSSLHATPLAWRLDITRHNNGPGKQIEREFPTRPGRKSERVSIRAAINIETP